MGNKIIRCKRDDCFAYSHEGYRNNCYALCEVVPVDCPFYKKGGRADRDEIEKDIQKYATVAAFRKI